MKNKILFLAVLTLLFARCIPSLHPIYTDQNRIVDDSIVGDWFSSAFVKNSKNIDLEVKTTSDITIDEESIFDAILDDQANSFYKFEKAATIIYTKKTNAKTHSTVTLTNQRQSKPQQNLIDKGYSITNVEFEPFYILTYKEKEDDVVSEEILLVNLTKIGNQNYMDFKPLEELESPNPFGINWVPAHTFAKYSISENGLTIQSFDADYIEKLIKDKRVRLKHETIDDSIVLTASTNDLRSFILKYGEDEKLFIEGDLLQSI